MAQSNAESCRKYLDKGDNRKIINKKRVDKANADREEYRRKAREYYHKNKDKMNASQRKYKATKRKEDMLYKLTENLRSSIGNSFRRKKFKKNGRTEEILGCTYNEVKKHIESQWEPWMNWDNHGLYNGEEGFGWDIDHIIPLKTADTLEELIELNHYTNLQPLCSKKIE